MLTRSALLFAVAAVPAILGFPSVFADMRHLAEALGMPPAEWHWWNYLMVGGGLFVMALSVYGMGLSVYRIFTHRSDPQKHAYSVDAESISHRWHVSQPTVTVTRTSFWTRIKRLLSQQSPFPVGTTDEDAVNRNPGNGRRMIRLIMNAETVDRIEDLYSDFESASPRTSEADVFAAYGLKKIRLMRASKEDEERLWRELLEEAQMDEHLEDIYAALTRLSEEYPDE